MAATSKAVAAPGEGSKAEEEAKQAATQQVRKLLGEEESLNMKLMELSQELAEHRRVLETLGKYDEDRKCYHRVGDVLVEGTVKSTAPEVQVKAENLEKLVNVVRTQYELKAKERVDLQTKHNIRLDQR